MANFEQQSLVAFVYNKLIAKSNVNFDDMKETYLKIMTNSYFDIHFDMIWSQGFLNL